MADARYKVVILHKGDTKPVPIIKTAETAGKAENAVRDEYGDRLLDVLMVLRDSR